MFKVIHPYRIWFCGLICLFPGSMSCLRSYCVEPFFIRGLFFVLNCQLMVVTHSFCFLMHVIYWRVFWDLGLYPCITKGPLRPDVLSFSSQPSWNWNTVEIHYRFKNDDIQILKKCWNKAQIWNYSRFSKANGPKVP